LYFESIHPFEDGNGRVGRAISEKALAQGHDKPTISGLAAAILVRRPSYYETLERANKTMDVTDWLTWFAGIVLEAQHRSLARVEFVLDKTRLLDRLRGSTNSRQKKAVLRMLKEGPGGFAGGLSAANYLAITKTSVATATRDLAELVEVGALRREGERKYTRYYLTIPLRPTPRITIDSRGTIVETLPK
jgi:Fic family protein